MTLRHDQAVFFRFYRLHRSPSPIGRPDWSLPYTPHFLSRCVGIRPGKYHLWPGIELRAATYLSENVSTQQAIQTKVATASCTGAPAASMVTPLKSAVALPPPSSATRNAS